MPRRRNIRPTVLARDGKVCAACGKPCPDDAEVDHRVPLALGGDDDPAQCEVLCRGCHRAKTRGDITRIAKAKRVGKRESIYQQRMNEKAGR